MHKALPITTSTGRPQLPRPDRFSPGQGKQRPSAAARKDSGPGHEFSPARIEGNAPPGTGPEPAGTGVWLPVTGRACALPLVTVIACPCLGVVPYLAHWLVLCLGLILSL